jgi:hypothetical protein
MGLAARPTFSSADLWQRVRGEVFQPNQERQPKPPIAPTLATSNWGETDAEATSTSNWVATSLFMSYQVREFAESLKINLLNSSPYYAQANGQVESSNKIVIKLSKKKIDEHPKRWHEVLLEDLWAHRISKHSATKVTPFELVYGQDAILPVEVNLDGLWIARQNELPIVDYHNLMINRLDEASYERMKA